jgi:hypothetical protein
MSTLCFLPVRTAVQLIALARMFLAKLAIFWIFFSSPSAVVTGLLGRVLHSVLPDHSLALSLAIPLLAGELVADTLLLVGVWRSARLCLVPWLALNSALILAAAAGTVSLLVPAILPLAGSAEPGMEHRTEAALREINRSLLIILFNLVLIGQMVNVSAVVRVLVDLRRKRRVSFSGKVERKEVPSVSMYEMPPPPPVFPEDDEEAASTTSSFEDCVPTVRCSLMDNPNIAISEEGEGGQVARESWNSLKFTFDKDNFA